MVPFSNPIWGKSTLPFTVLQTKVLLYPPQAVLDTFWPLYNSVTNQIQTTTTEINCLGDVRDTLLPKLMSGELKINEIDC